MDKNRKKLKIWSIVLLIIAALDGVSIIYNYFIGGYSVNSYPEYPEYIIQIAIIIVLGVSVLNMLIKLFLGIRGLKELNGIQKGTSHIILARIYIIALIISLIIWILDFNLTIDYIIDVCNVVLNICIVFDYVRCVKKLRS